MPFPFCSGLRSPSSWPLLPCVASRLLPVTKHGPAEGLVSLQWDSRLCPSHPHPARSPHYSHPRLRPRGPDGEGGWLSQGIYGP